MTNTNEIELLGNLQQPANKTDNPLTAALSNRLLGDAKKKIRKSYFRKKNAAMQA